MPADNITRSRAITLRKQLKEWTQSRRVHPVYPNKRLITYTRSTGQTAPSLEVANQIERWYNQPRPAPAGVQYLPNGPVRPLNLTRLYAQVGWSLAGTVAA